MSETIKKIREVLLEKCEQHKSNPKYGYYDYWNDHIKRVVYHAVALANQYGADAEIVELGALLHDISMPAEYGDRSAHNVYSAEMTENLLGELGYPEERIERVKNCVLNHPSSNRQNRKTLEEACVAEADALAHFDRIPSLFSLAYKIMGMSIDEGKEYVKEKLQGDYYELSEQTKESFKSKYEIIMETLFVD